MWVLLGYCYKQYRYVKTNFEMSATRTINVSCLEQLYVGADEVEVVLGCDVVDPPQLPLELLAVGPYREVDLHHVVHHHLPVLLRDVVILKRGVN